MKNKNLILCLTLLISLMSNAQVVATNDTGEGKRGNVEWSNGLSWSQVLAKAKSENKYIFLDCFTTWCSPCKQMDVVYANDSVGDYFNERFVSVKVQLDQTKNDNDAVKSWYRDADSISKKYRVIAYPTFIFLSPGGMIVHKDIGFKPAGEFLEVAKTALIPGKIYDDPYRQYDSLLSNYEQGNKDYSRMAYIIGAAQELGDTAMFRKLLKDYMSYLSELKKEDLYTKQNIAFIADHINSKSKLFSIFYPDGSKINTVMDKTGYAERIVSQIIQREMVNPFLKVDPGEWTSLPPDYREAEWSMLYKKIKLKYNEEYAKRTLLTGRMNWYFFYHNYPAFAKYYILYLNENGVDTSNLNAWLTVNLYAWEVFFKHIDNKSQLNSILRWVSIIIRPSNYDYGVEDTYANLLYKAGRVEEGIQWEQKALNAAVNNHNDDFIKEFQERLDKMKRGQATWTDVH